MSPLCQKIGLALAKFSECETSPDGARIETHCLYPSFEPVKVYVVKFGDGYIVHDGGDARSIAWAHGRDERSVTRYIGEYAKRFGLSFDGGQIKVTVENDDWLRSAILSVANAAAHGVTAAVEHTARSAADALKSRIHRTLIRRFSADRVKERAVRTGGEW